jgi:hypothetical protein
MGYYVTTTEVDFRIPKRNLDAAYKALCALNDNDDAKTGGRLDGGNDDRTCPRPAGLNHHPARWFAWMPANYPEECADAEAVLECLGFEVGMEQDDLVIWHYDNKTGAEELFIGALAPFVKDGSFICWRGEDGDEWRYIVQDGVMTEQRLQRKVWA